MGIVLTLVSWLPTPMNCEASPPTPAPAELCERAATLVRSHPECFWFRHPEARIRHLENVRLEVEHIREYGDRRVWWDAQELHRCLSPLHKKDVLVVLAGNRSAESRFAGGIVLNAAEGSARFSHDLDIFHELAGN
jgi:hypothetical protein